MATKHVVKVTITSDLMCPWCWVGLRRLQEEACKRLPQVETVITWKPFCLLRPNDPEDGTPKGGSPESRVGNHLKWAGLDVGIDFTSGLPDPTPSTLLFHSVMKMLQQDGCSHQLATSFHEAVFNGYFTLGIYHDKQGLLTVARKLEGLQIVDKKIEADSLHRHCKVGPTTSGRNERSTRSFSLGCLGRSIL